MSRSMSRGSLRSQGAAQRPGLLLPMKALPDQLVLL